MVMMMNGDDNYGDTNESYLLYIMSIYIQELEAVNCCNIAWI